MSSSVSRNNLEKLGRTPTTDSVTLTLADTAYSYDFPAKTVQIGFQLRTQAYDLKYAYATNGVYIVVPAGSPGGFINDIHTGDSTLTVYFKCADAAGQILDLTYWVTE